jgi:hypothetical protein
MRIMVLFFTYFSGTDTYKMDYWRYRKYIRNAVAYTHPKMEVSRNVLRIYNY